MHGLFDILFYDYNYCLALVYIWLKTNASISSSLRAGKQLKGNERSLDLSR